MRGWWVVTARARVHGSCKVHVGEDRGRPALRYPCHPSPLHASGRRAGATEGCLAPAAQSGARTRWSFPRRRAAVEAPLQESLPRLTTVAMAPRNPRSHVAFGLEKRRCWRVSGVSPGSTYVWRVGKKLTSHRNRNVRAPAPLCPGGAAGAFLVPAVHVTTLPPAHAYDYSAVWRPDAGLR